MRVAIVGCGTAGPAAALLLMRDGHEVTVFERVTAPRGLGAGILLQPLGQRVLAEIGLADALEARSSPVLWVDAETPSGRTVMDFAYEDVVPGVCGWGVSRAALFDLLWEALRASPVELRVGAEVTGLRVDARGWWLSASEGVEAGPFDLVVGADGARSRIRRLTRLASKDVGYPYGALWTIVPDADGIAGDALFQRYRDTRVTLGVLPTGVRHASFFWSVRSRDIAPAIAAGAHAWADSVRRYAGRMAPLLDHVAEGGLLAARYRDVVVRSPALVREGRGLVLLGDAAHAMSPQLGLGASLGLADAWSLAASVRAKGRDIPGALQAHVAARRGHVRYYTWCSRLMTPFFQSDLVPLGWGRDLLAAPVARIPWVRRQFVTTLMGIRTSPWTTWTPPR